MRTTYFILLLLVAGLASCKRKPEPTDETGAPVFYAKGVVGSEMLNIEAGNDSYYLNTSDAFGSDQVYTFSGDFSQKCATCKRALKVTIRDYRKSDAGYVFSADSSLAAGSFEYSLDGFANIPYYTLNLNATPSGVGNLNSQLWEFSDGSTATSAVLSKTFKTGTSQEIKYTCNYSNNCSSTITYNLSLKPFMDPQELPDFTISRIDTDAVMYRFVAKGNGNATYLWDMGDGIVKRGRIIVYGFDSSLVYKVQLKQVKGEDTSQVSKYLNAGASNTCKANFTRELIAVKDTLNLSTIVVEWTNAAGEKYASGAIKQDLSAAFLLNGSFPYKNNQAGQKTRLLDLNINCRLSNGAGSIDVKDLKVRMAVAQPD